MVRPLNQQIVVITGASSGIGRSAALQFGEAGATVVLAARNEEALRKVANLIDQRGGRSLVVPTDVTDWGQVQHLAETTVDTFGRIDTWVNNAGVSVYATAEQTEVEETQRIIQTNFMGVVHGVSAVLPIMRAQGYGTIINVGSVESQRALPLQAAYGASKHAVKGYTEALRMEQMYEKSGVNVTLIMPSGINTPLFNHARSKTGYKPMPVPPVYTPELAGQAIVRAAQAPQRDIYVGGAGFFFWLLQKISPALVDRLMITGGSMYRLQTSNDPYTGPDNLYQPVGGTGRVEGDFESLTKPSMYTPAFEFTPRWIRSIAALAIPAAVVAVITGRQGRDMKKRR
jgi:short-subunit dehydrogenase